MWGLSRCRIGIWSELEWGGSAKNAATQQKQGLLYKRGTIIIIFTNSAPLGRVGQRVAMSVCLFVCLSVYAIGCSFVRPLIGPDMTWSVPGFSLVLPPSLSCKLGNLETWKLTNLVIQKIKNLETLTHPTPPPTKKYFCLEQKTLL